MLFRSLALDPHAVVIPIDLRRLARARTALARILAVLPGAERDAGGVRCQVAWREVVVKARWVAAQTGPVVACLLEDRGGLDEAALASLSAWLGERLRAAAGGHRADDRRPGIRQSGGP